MELIKIEHGRIGGSSVQTINARELHAFLEVGKDFSTWIKDRIEQYGFLENQDFVSFPQNGGKPTGGRPTKDYAITLDMAKELAMVERNEKGKQARQYFIDCERRAKHAPQPELSRLELLQMAIDSEQGRLAAEKKNMLLENKVIELAPKAQFHDDIASAINCQTFDEVAKELGTGRIRLCRWLREQGYLMANNDPYQRYIDMGLFKMVPRTRRDNRSGETISYNKTLITGKGLTHIHKRIKGLPIELPANDYHTENRA